MYSVLYLTVIPSPYKVSFFNELGKHCDLTVLFERGRSNKRESNWLKYDFREFNGVILDANKSSLLKHLQSQRYDMVIIANYSTVLGMISMLYLNTKNIPYTISVDGGLIDYKESKLKRNYKTLLISNANSWLSTGEHTTQYLSYYGAKSDNIYVYPFTTMKKDQIIEFPLANSSKDKIRHSLNIPYKKMIVSVGRFIYSKGFDILIKSASHFVEGTGIYIIGGTITDEYKQIINEYNIENVHFIDFMDYDELKEYYLAADVFVFPTRQDVWGLVINEAMANGLPVVTTTNCVAGLEMVEDGVNGFIVSNEDIEEIITKTNRILSNQKLQREMAANSIKAARAYTIENMALKTFNIIKKLLQ